VSVAKQALLAVVEFLLPAIGTVLRALAIKWEAALVWWTGTGRVVRGRQQLRVSGALVLGIGHDIYFEMQLQYSEGLGDTSFIFYSE
jgi:hypothetical protein